MAIQRLALLTCIMLLGAVCAWAQDENSAKTSGLTCVSVTKSIVDSKFCYEFTLTNNSDPLHPFVDSNGKQYLILVDKLIVDPSKVLQDPAAANVRVPSADWAWTKNGHEKFTDTQRDKYKVLPSVGPGQTLSGLKYCYDTDPGIDPNDFTFIAHVLAVDPTFTYDDPPADTVRRYKGVTVSLPGSGNQGTWFDAPRSAPRSAPVVPEASSLLLGAMGLMGPVVLRLRKRA